MKLASLHRTLAVLCTLSLTGCGVIKGREDHVVVVGENAGNNGGRNQGGSGSDSGDSEDASLRQIKQFLDLYTDHGAVTREGLGNFIEKYKTQIGPFLAGLHMSAQELIDLAFKFDANHDQHLTPQELSEGISQRIPILHWIPDNNSSITRTELDTQIAREYPQTSGAAQSGLAETLMRFDLAFAGGNADGKLSRAELSGAGLILGIITQTDFTHGLQVPPGAIAPVNGADGTQIDITPLADKLLQQKLDQQLLGRYNATSSSGLSADDLRLEWMQLGLRFFLVDKLANPERGRLAESQVAQAMATWGFPQQSHWAAFRKIYDNALMAGDGDGYFNTLELFNVISDFDFARKVRTLLRGDFSARAVAANPSTPYLMSVLIKLMPRTGASLFTNDQNVAGRIGGSIRAEYWDRFNQFDTQYSGGNDDGMIDDGEAAMGLLYAKQIENLYELFDDNHDGSLTRYAEGNQMFAALGIYDRRIIDAFYANIGLNSAAPGFWAKLKLFFGGDHGWKYLRANDFHNRLVQVLPRLLEKGAERL